MTSQPPPVQILPQATIQHTFPDVLSEVYGGTTVAEDVWLSCYKQGETSVHGKVGAALHARDRELVELTGRDGVGLERVSEFVYRATCDSLGIDPKITLPAGTYADPVHSRETLPHQIPALATTPDGGMLASAFADGTLAIYALPPLSAPATPYPPSQKRAVEPLKTGRVHLSSIVAAHILPKTDLLASAGVDFRVCITALPSAPLSSTTSTAPSDGTTLQPRVTLTGHTRALTDLIPLSTDGLEIVTGAKDGTVRVWDVRKEAQAGVVATAGMRAPNALASDEGGIVYAVLSDGALQAFDVRARASAHTVEAGVVACGGLSAVAIVRGTGAEGETVAVGGARGVCGAYDVRAGKMRARWARGGASIENIAPVGHGRVVVGGEDGLPYVAALDGGDSGPVKVESELVFGDIEAVRCFEVHPDGDPGEVWAAGDGGVVRRYRL